MLKIKRIIAMALMCCLVGGTVYAANLVVTNNTKYYESAVRKVKTSKDNSARITLTSGPIRMRDYVSTYIDLVGKTDKTSYASDTTTFYMPESNVKVYYNPFDYNKFCGKIYTIYAIVAPGSYSSTISVKGDFTP